VTPPVVRPPTELPIEPQPPEDITIPVTVYLAPMLRDWAIGAADAEGMSLASWIAALVERARDA
jgi:hypothetical protein